MGNRDLRRLYKQQNCWSDKTAPRHKHSYTKHAIMQLLSADGLITYYDAMFCEHCHSFRCIPKPHNVSGFISDPTTIDVNLSIMRFRTSHNLRIGFSDLTFIDEGRFSSK